MSPNCSLLALFDQRAKNLAAERATRTVVTGMAERPECECAWCTREERATLLLLLRVPMATARFRGRLQCASEHSDAEHSGTAQRQRPDGHCDATRCCSELR